MNSTDVSSSPVVGNHGPVVLDSSSVHAMRHRLHELANVFTGVMIAAGLLSQYLEAGPLGHYAKDIARAVSAAAPWCGSFAASCWPPVARPKLASAGRVQTVRLRGQ